MPGQSSDVSWPHEPPQKRTPDDEHTGGVSSSLRLQANETMTTTAERSTESHREGMSRGRRTRRKLGTYRTDPQWAGLPDPPENCRRCRCNQRMNYAWR
jgi:hypothetical protein